ncbi:SctD/MshK family protein [Oceanicaulis sp. UBA2681]|uniref:SctD/MshK family protein n=1 Tax=Oceanicaulis sp. UBA2681 TaxID=1947007 RepID=UPI000EC8E75F|nr:hypothetical protein [Oceanicaulis sp. UBA2681]HCR67308.1 hypothetical protein [Oceanicaulis sp.]|tara:strand:+ start:9750 stop:10238 length:489 start_codon:yes stop_codon:yes gene_type:complete
MTSRLRLLMAGFAAVAALLFGWLNGVSNSGDAPEGRRSGLTVPQLAAAEDIDRAVRAIYESNLFPNAHLRQENGEGDGTGAPQTVEELEQSLRDPSLSALVKREDVWRIFLYGDNEGAQVREVGDQLADGWIIQDITSTSVLLQKGEQTRLIETFKAEPDTQ